MSHKCARVLLDNGELTGALPGQIIRGPLYHGTQA